MFSIKSVSKISSDTVRVTVTMYAKDWHKANRSLGSNGLGCLYGIDISNAVHEQYGVKSSNPTVDDSLRAVNGVKTLVLFYNDPAWVELANNVIRVDFVARKRVA